MNAWKNGRPRTRERRLMQQMKEATGAEEDPLRTEGGFGQDDLEKDHA